MACQMLITDIKKDKSKHHGLEYAGRGTDGEARMLNCGTVEGFTINAETWSRWETRSVDIWRKHVSSRGSCRWWLQQQHSGHQQLWCQWPRRSPGAVRRAVAQDVQWQLWQWCSHQMVLWCDVGCSSGSYLDSLFPACLWNLVLQPSQGLTGCPKIFSLHFCSFFSQEWLMKNLNRFNQWVSDPQEADVSVVKRKSLPHALTYSSCSKEHKRFLTCVSCCQLPCPGEMESYVYF